MFFSWAMVKLKRVLYLFRINRKKEREKVISSLGKGTGKSVVDASFFFALKSEIFIEISNDRW